MKGSEFKVTIAGEDFPTFSLNITQQILELQKERASEEKIQEQTSAQKQSVFHWFAKVENLQKSVEVLNYK